MNKRALLASILGVCLILTTGCTATLRAAAKAEVRRMAYLAADDVVERVVDRMELEPETAKEAKELGKKIAREEIDKQLSDTALDQAAAKEDEDAPAPAEPAPADPQ